jgi:hypothetical protein
VLVHHASWLIGVMPQAQRCSGRRILTGESFLPKPKYIKIFWFGKIFSSQI